MIPASKISEPHFKISTIGVYLQAYAVFLLLKVIFYIIRLYLQKKHGSNYMEWLCQICISKRGNFQNIFNKKEHIKNSKP